MAGFDVALAKYIANYMGLELEIIPMDFDGVLRISQRFITREVSHWLL